MTSNNQDDYTNADMKIYAINMDSILQGENIDRNFSTTDDDKPDPPVSLVIADDISGF